MDRQIDVIAPIVIHPVEEPVTDDINNNFKNIETSLKQMDKIMSKSAMEFKNLLLSSKLKINGIKDMLKSEKERLQDINILCNNYSDFENILNLSKDDFTGNLNFDDGVITAAIDKKIKSNIQIGSIEGNGLEGNSYVYLKDAFLSESINSNNRLFISDNNIATAYEYQRITISNDEIETPVSFNKDAIEAECNITLSSSDNINEIKIISDRNDLIVRDIYTSVDGLSYKQESSNNVEINNINEIYNTQNYIFKNGTLAINPAKHVKVSLRSNSYTNDRIAVKKTFIDDKNSNKKIEKVYEIESAKRHLIRINEITAYKNKYKKGMFISRELITTPVSCVGIFCNEYIASGYTIEKNVSYILIINGIEHNVVPINCHRNDKKIIRSSTQIYDSDNVIYLNEEIKSAKLKIIINNANEDITPYISNIKVLVGENK